MLLLLPWTVVIDKGYARLSLSCCGDCPAALK